MFVDELRRAAEVAPRDRLSDVAKALWAALAASQIGEEEAGAISALIEARRAPAVNSETPSAPRRFVGSRPRSGASMERRRRWAATGLLPPQLAARFTLAEAAVLALVAAETRRRGDCRLAVGHLAAIAGVSETTVRNALREARRHGLITIEERRLTGFRNDTNVVRIIAREWLSWLKLRPASAGSLFGADQQRGQMREGGGCRIPQGTPTKRPPPGIGWQRKPK